MACGGHVTLVELPMHRHRTLDDVAMESKAIHGKIQPEGKHTGQGMSGVTRVMDMH